MKANEMNCRVYPNPFRDQTTFEYELNEATAVKLIIFNQLGKEIAILENGAQSEHQIVWNAEGLPSGIYFYRLIAGIKSSVGKIVVVR